MPDLDLDGLPFKIKLVPDARYGLVEGIRLSPQAIGAAKSLYHVVKLARENLQTDSIQRSTALSDGTVITVGSAGDRFWGVIRIPDRPTAEKPAEKLKQRLEPSHYVESAWIQQTVGGPVTDAVNPPVASDQTDDMAGLDASLTDFFDGKFGSRNRKQAFRLVANIGQYTPEEYETLKTAAVTNINEKIAAQFATGYTTGLLRCFIRGKLGRDVREVTITTSWPPTKNFVVDGWNVVLEKDAILAAPNGFVYLRCEETYFNVWYPTLPEELQPYYARFYALPNGTFKRAVAVCLLAYATVKNVTASEGIPAQPQNIPATFVSPYNNWGGLLYGYFNNRAVKVESLGADANNRRIHGLVEATYTVAANAGVIQWSPPAAATYPEPFTAVVTELERGHYTTGSSPRAWYPLNPGQSWVLRDVDPGANAPCEPSVPIWGFYDNEDNLVVARVGMPKPPVTISNSNNIGGTACAPGPVYFNSYVEAGNDSEIFASVDGGPTINAGLTYLFIKGVTKSWLFGQYVGGGGTGGEAGGSGITIEGCGGSSASLSGSFPRKTNLEASGHMTTQTSRTWQDEFSGTCAIVVPYYNVDAVFLADTMARNDVTTDQTIERSGIYGVGIKWDSNPNTSAIASGVTINTMFGGQGVGGTVVSNVIEEFDNSESYKRLFLRTAFGSQEIAMTQHVDPVFNTPLVIDMDAAFYAAVDFYGNVRVSAFGQYQLTAPNLGSPVGFQ